MTSRMMSTVVHPSMTTLDPSWEKMEWEKIHNELQTGIGSEPILSPPLSVVGDAKEIWEQLQLDRKIEITFLTKNEAEKFRIRLQQVKAAAEKVQLEIGFLEYNQVQSLLFRLLDSSAKEQEEGGFTYIVSLGKRQREATVYSFRVVE